MHPLTSPPLPSPPLPSPPSFIRPQSAGSSQKPNYVLGHRIRSNSACRTILPRGDDFSISMPSQTPGCENEQVDLQKEEDGEGGREKGGEGRGGLDSLFSAVSAIQLHTRQCRLSAFEAVLFRPPRTHQMCLYALSYMQPM